MVKVSVIVPIYNKEEYLERCITSILNQTLKDIEIILVNDGSTDHSLNICYHLSKKDPRIIIIDKVNEGVSIARNKGISAAKGKYIAFVDADDYIEPDMYQKMLSQCERTNSKICICNYYDDDNREKHPMKIDINQEVLIDDEIEEKLILDVIGPATFSAEGTTVMGAAWRLLIEKEWLIEKNITFPNHIPLREDQIFFLNVLVEADQICIDEACHYHYITVENSALQKYRESIFELSLNVNNKIDHIIKKLDSYEEARNRMQNSYLDIVIGSIINEVHINNPYTSLERVKRIGQMITHEEVQSAMQNLDENALNTKRKIVYRAIKYKKASFLYLLYLFSQNKVFRTK